MRFHFGRTIQADGITPNHLEARGANCMSSNRTCRIYIHILFLEVGGTKSVVPLVQFLRRVIGARHLYESTT